MCWHEIEVGGFLLPPLLVEQEEKIEERLLSAACWFFFVFYLFYFFISLFLNAGCSLLFCPLLVKLSKKNNQMKNKKRVIELERRRG